MIDSTPKYPSKSIIGLTALVAILAIVGLYLLHLPYSHRCSRGDEYSSITTDDSVLEILLVRLIP